MFEQGIMWDKHDMLIPVRGMPRDPDFDYDEEETEDVELDYNDYDDLQEDFEDEDESYLREQGIDEDEFDEITPSDEFLDEGF